MARARTRLTLGIRMMDTINMTKRESIEADIREAEVLSAFSNDPTGARKLLDGYKKELASMGTDPRGPMRTIVSVDDSATSETLVTKSCGHVGHMNQTFIYKAGEMIRCFQCGPHGVRT